MPPPILIGDTTAKIIQEEIFLDPDKGDRAVIVWEGSETEMKTTGAIYRAIGAEAHVAPFKGPVWRARVVGSPTMIGGGEEPEVERWTRRVETAQVDIRNNPQVIEAAGGSSSTLSLWIKQIKDALKAGTGLSGTVDPNHQALFDLYARGAETYEVARMVLVRRLSMGLNELHQSTIVEVPSVFSTPKFIEAFHVPKALGDHLPVTPSPAPSNYAWGWRERDDDENITPIYNKVESVRTWVFGLHSTLLYQHVA